MLRKNHVRRSSKNGLVMTHLHCKTLCERSFIPENLNLTQMLLNAFFNEL